MHPDQANSWNYSDEDALGPAEWPKYFQTGDLQSPINIIVDHCYLNQHHLASMPTTTVTNKLHEQLSRKLVIGGVKSNRREHLDSVGNETNDQYLLNSRDDRLIAHHDRRSASTSSNNSSVSNESNSSNDLETAPFERFGHDHDDHHHHHRHHHHKQHHHHHHRQDDPRRHHHSQSQLCRVSQAEAQQVQNTRYCGTNKKIFLGYPRYLNSVRLSNTGHGWQVDMPPELACHTLLSGPALGDREYRLAQFHCHWGEDCDHGSEHQLNGRSFSAEIHFVHWNCSQFKSLEEASRHKHGLAVLGVFVQALDGEQNRNKHLDKIISGINDVRDRPNGSTQLSDIRLGLKKLFPSNRWNYATYEGSLTTPPLSECVDWLVFLQPITCSSSQIDQFRRIKCPSGPLTRNCRPVQPLNKRTVTIWTHHSSPVSN